MGGAARADDFQFASYQQIGATLQQQEQEIGQLRAELASLRSEVAGSAVAGPAAGAISYSQGCCNDGCGNACGSSCCNDGCGCCNTGCCNSSVCESCCGLDALAYQTGCGWFVFGEALIVKPFNQFGGLGQGGFQLNPTPRVSLGWVGDSGFGVRARYWVFNDTAPYIAGTTNQLQTHVLDVEATDRICLGKWIATGSAGLRYVNYVNRVNVPAGAAPGFAIRNTFEGLGVVGGLDLVRPFACNWSFYGNARYSILMGQAQVGVPAAALNNSIRDIAELGVGLQYNRSLYNGMNLIARGGFEAQYWGGFGGVAFPLADTGFAGLTFGAGVSY